MLRHDNDRGFARFLRVGIIALTVAASSQAFARGEGGGGGGGGGEGGAGEVAAAVVPPQPPTIPVPNPTIELRGRSTPTLIPTNNCKLEMRQIRWC